MRKVLIVGAGQSALQLALGLLQYGYDVTVMSARTAAEIRAGRVTSTQVMFDASLQHERDLGLDFWEKEVPPTEGMGVSVAGPDEAPAIDWLGWLDRYAQSIDQRIKMADWMELFEERGGKLVIHGVTVSDLDRLAGMFDLVIVAAGKGELVEMFDRDPSRSPFSAPQRALTVAYTHGMGPMPTYSDGPVISINLIPDVGEYVVMPGYTFTGPCNMLLVEGIPGGPLDCFADVSDPEEILGRAVECVRTYVPWEYERVRTAELTDSQGTLSGRFPPTVRHPVGRLPSGDAVFGMADVVVLNDPISGQGSNNASKCAASYLQSILEHGDRPFDPEFMQHAFAEFWSNAKYSTTFSNMLLQPFQTCLPQILEEAGQDQEVADRFVNAFDNPSDFAGWIMDSEATQDYLVGVSTGSDRSWSR